MPSAYPRVPARVLAGISCLSAAILIVELALTRIFSVTMYYHFAFLAVSIAMFGLGASSVFVYVTPRWHPPERALSHLARYATLFWIVTLVAAVVLIRVRVDLHYSSGAVARLLVVYLVAAMPFAAGGAGLAVAVSRLHGDIGRVYAFDLAGAACGCLLLIPALDVFGGPGALLFASGLAALAAPLFAPAGERRRGALSIVPLVAAATGLAVQVWHPWLDVREAKGREAERPIFSKWNSFSRVAVIDREHQDWGLSDTYKGPHVRSLYMDIDSSASTPILEGGPLDGPISYLRYEITGLAYALRAPERVLVIGPGGGRDLWTALVGGARRVEGVEVNPIIVDDVMTSRFKVFSGDVYHAPGVKVVVDDGRSYVSRSPEQFDVIQASLVDTWAATSAGAFAMTENNLYTVEAFEAYLRHLTPDGVLTITRWYADSLRLVSLAHAAGRRLGWPGLTDRMFLARNGTVMTLILKNSPLSDDEVRTLAATCDRLKFGIVYAPVTASHPQPPARNDYTRLITTDNTDRFYRSYYFDITPTTDDRPFFFHTQFPGQTTMKFDRTLLFGSGYETLRTVLVLSFVLVTVFILLPLAGFSPEPIGDVRRALAPVAYFACLGTGFMLVEIGLTQRFVLFLGHPVYALTVILFTLLLGGGLGSALSRRVGGSPRATIAIVIPLVVVAGLVYATALPPIFAAWIGLPRAARILLSVALLLPLGVLLGMPLPAGVRILGQRPGLLAWAWGVNGATSIFGASGAILIAMNWGFGRVATIGASVYAAAWLLGLVIGRSERDENPEVHGVGAGRRPLVQGFLSPGVQPRRDAFSRLTSAPQARQDQSLDQRSVSIRKRSPRVLPSPS